MARLKDPKNYVIIGNSAAALAAIRAIRKMGDFTPITLIAKEPYNAYSPVLTTYYIAGSIKKSGLFLVDERFYHSFNVKALLGRMAIAVDAERNVVHLDDGRDVLFKKLLIATGASPRTLDDIDEEVRDHVVTLRTLTDAERIKVLAREAKRIVLIGAGLVTLQTLTAIFDKNKAFSLIEVKDQILPRQLDSTAARIIRRRLEKEGVEIFLGRGVDRVLNRAGQVTVVTNFGESLPADLVIVGIGVNPNTEIVKDTGIKTNAGIIVDDHMRTNVKNIFAAGDVAEGTNTLTGQAENIATWASACTQGQIAGMNMAGFSIGVKDQYRENVTSIMGLPAAIIGLTYHEKPEPDGSRYIDEKRSVYRRLVMDGPYVMGAILLGRIEDAGVIRYCIGKRIDISMWKERAVTGSLSFGNTMFTNYFTWPVYQNDHGIA